jgi:hypothetical protein
MKQVSFNDYYSDLCKENNFASCFINEKKREQVWKSPWSDLFKPLFLSGMSIQNTKIKKDTLYNIVDDIDQVKKQTGIPWLYTALGRDQVYPNATVFPLAHWAYVYDSLIKRIELIDPKLFTETLKKEVIATNDFARTLPQRTREGFLGWTSKTYNNNRYENSYAETRTTEKINDDQTAVTDFIVRKHLINSIIAHEIGHTQQFVEMTLKYGFIAFIMNLLYSLPIISTVSRFFLNSSCSRHFEYDADRFATMHGYGQGLVSMLDYVLCPTTHGELVFKESSAGDFYLNTISYFRTHPIKNDRIAAIHDTINNYPRLKTIADIHNKENPAHQHAIADIRDEENPAHQHAEERNIIDTHKPQTNFFYDLFNHYIMRLFNYISLNEIDSVKNELFDLQTHCNAVTRDTGVTLNELYLSQNNPNFVIQSVPIFNTLFMSEYLLGMINTVDPALFNDAFKQEVMQKQHIEHIEEVTDLQCKIHLLRSLLVHNTRFLTKFVKNEEDASFGKKFYNFFVNLWNSFVSLISLLVTATYVLLASIPVLSWLIKILDWNVHTVRNQEADHYVVELGYGEGYKFALRHGFTGAPAVYDYMEEEQVGMELQRYSYQFLGWRIPTQTRINIIDEHIAVTPPEPQDDERAAPAVIRV